MVTAYWPLSRSTSIGTHTHAAARGPRPRTSRTCVRGRAGHCHASADSGGRRRDAGGRAASVRHARGACAPPIRRPHGTWVSRVVAREGLSWLLELVNVSTGLPWSYTIIAGTLLSRLLLVPFSIKQSRNSAALAPHQPRLLELKEELNRAYQTGDKIGVQRAALEQRRVYEESGVSMLPMLLMPFVQLPVTLGMLFGVKRLPLEQLHWNGVSFLPDLTVADPFYVLPIAAAVLMNVQLSVGASDMAATADRATAVHMFNVFRVVSVISIPLMGHFPSGLNLIRLDGDRSNPRANFHLGARCRPSDLAYPTSAEEHEYEARNIPGIH
ncbi:60Kd inner membrane protein-domain-containing protein [Lactarius deliciosus]|nr:60Kd inner membrane protein-domain-containing protein [Lactarius deliciosus]